MTNQPHSPQQQAPSPVAIPAPVPAPPPIQQLTYATPPVGRTDLRTIAIRQRVIICCVLAYIVAVVMQIVIPPPFNALASLLVLAAGITGAVFVFMLAIALYNTGAGVVLGILTLIPLIGLIVLLIINGKATTVLREHGLQVGLMGAKLDQIPGAGQVPIR